MNTGALIKELRAVFTICFSILGLSNLLPKKQEDARQVCRKGTTTGILERKKTSELNRHTQFNFAHIVTPFMVRK